MHSLAFNYNSETIGGSFILYADCFDWLAQIPENSIHGVVTDPPYGVKEYDIEQIKKRSNGKGGIWRIPPSYDGHQRSPLPRFTALTQKERTTLKCFFIEWSKLVVRVLRPGGHVFVASNAFLSQLVFSALVEGGLEFRGELIRLVRTLRGGDRPKNAEQEFPHVSSMPRGCYEPWGILRKPIPSGMKVSDCLREFQTGGLRRTPDGNPFNDVIFSERTPRQEREIANHPSLKPQSFLRQLVHAVLPLGEGILIDPFMGSGSTVAAAEAVGVCCIGIERYTEYYQMSRIAIPQLAALNVSPHLQKSTENVDVQLSTDSQKHQQLTLW
ncbi:DNA methylase [Coleofasciculus chthonoplastes PCC 7420]|uniref:Methyltransferase n=1 Tax=Coleofasciculus chthonoplastes PCC 7420 TaxID=118168 RepID=B4VVI6_9CYAN|nr:DNA methyltransferase [Coleofasciculus chthonoplastes]EDX73889.1 DNA methylase [Coleofasciculus chthonoplastes PCC 7420]